MTDLALNVSPRSDAFRAGAAALALLALTSIHHAYGAIAFDTPWRLHILALVAPAAVAIAVALRRAATATHRSARRISTILAALIILSVPVAAIGFYEGGYNHVFKNIVYFIGGEARALSLFPPPLYEMPSDLVFEVTGIAQFPLAIATMVLTFRLFWERAR